jgi:MSHA biogenesis protein MshM
MYLDHFRLERLPFGLSPDPAFRVALPGFEDALAAVDHALCEGEGFIKVVGPVGAGKTLLCRALLERLKGSFASAYIADPELSPRELLVELARELGLSPAARATAADLRRALLDFALAERESGRSVALLVDEAQAMPAQTLESLRLLSNVEPDGRKLLQIVLFGQPELDARLARAGLRQLRQRFTTCVSLAPLHRGEIERYVDHRLLAAGTWHPELFSRSALALLARGSRGVPRLVNVIAHKALIAACAEGCERVLRRHVSLALADTADARRGPRVALRRIFGRRLREA